MISQKHPDSIRRAHAAVSALVDTGVCDWIYCPGSRNGPLGYVLWAAAERGQIQLTVKLDERSAAFCAVGLARAFTEPGRAGRRAVGVVCTSGTAAAELHPALAEADAAGLPIVAVTADRPAALIGTGANQTTRQAGMFAGIVRGSWDLQPFAPVDGAFTGQLRRAVAEATGLRSGNPGPVHVNMAFAEPLVPKGTDMLPALELPHEGDIDGFFAAPAAPAPLREPLPAGEGLVNARTVVVAGDRALTHPQLWEWLERQAFPILAEPSSGLRRHPRAVLAPAEMLEESSLAEEIERVVVLGHPTLSRPVMRLLADPEREVHVVSPGGAWTDPAGNAARVWSQLADLTEQITQAPDEQWLYEWKQGGYDRATDLLRSNLMTITREQAAAMIWQRTPGPLVLGASRMIRVFEQVAGWHAKPDRMGEFGPKAVYANRGLAGIDGTISTAWGVAMASGEPTRVVLGDLAFLHDFTGLVAGTEEDLPALQVVVINDEGGSIFSGLEHAEATPRLLRRMFTTPQRPDLTEMARGMGIDAATVMGPAGLDQELRRPITGLSVVEVKL